MRKRDEQTCVFQNFNVDFVCVLFVWCFFLLRLFLLKLFALQNRLRKDWFLSLLVCVFFFQPRITLATVCRCHLCEALPTIAPGTSLSARTDIIVWVPFVIPNYGRKSQRRKSVMLTVFQSCSLQPCDMGRSVVLSVVFSFLVVTMVRLQHRLHLFKKPHFGESYSSALGNEDVLINKMIF